MLSFDCLADAISKASLLKEFCFGVRVIVNKDATVLYSSLPDIGEDCKPVIGIPATGDNRLDETRKKSERKLSFGRNQAAYEISCVPIFIGGQSCTLEMIHPNRRVISAVTGASAQSFDHRVAPVSGLRHREPLAAVEGLREVAAFDRQTDATEALRHHR